MKEFYQNSTCFLRTCYYEPEGCFIDTDSAADVSRIAPISSVVCDPLKNVIRLSAYLEDNSINIKARSNATFSGYYY